MVMPPTIRELARRITEEIYKRYEVTRKLRDDDPYGSKPSMVDIIEKIINDLIN